ncbi:MAG TPA: hypothetical protein VJ901_08690 [Thermoanaerobaculia bacterium]|nr:hypothetical protein [Thermoanaerobaculia bacterium]
MIAMLLAAALAVTPKGAVVAHDHVIEIPNVWRANGVANPSLVVANDVQAATIDPLANEVAITDLATGKTIIRKTGETPIDALFLGRELYILNRDSRTLQHGNEIVDVAADPAYLRASRNRLYVYSRLEGVLQEIGTGRTLKLDPFASDMQLDVHYAYLTYPRAGKLIVVDLAKLRPFGEQKIGAVPISVAVMGRTIAIADPSAKKIWMIEGGQSFGQAVARGFLRGLLGLGLYRNRNSEFPSGIDRVVARGSSWIAYDSSTGTIYRAGKPVAQSIAPHAFALTGDGVVWWDDKALRLQKLTVVQHD